MLQLINSLPLKKPTLIEFRIQVRDLIYDNKFNYSRGDCSEHLTKTYCSRGINTSNLHRELHSSYGDLFYLKPNSVNENPT